MSKIRIHFPDDYMMSGANVRVPVCGSNGYKYAEEWSGVNCMKCLQKKETNTTARGTPIGPTVELSHVGRRLENGLTRS